tara:strand:- start:399 stop:1655 length:1257 start_codon:yes stop_codon:yes gene_type:complete
MTFKFIKTKSILSIEGILGVALGTGFLTEIRFWGLIGFPEIFMIFAILLLVLKNHNRIFYYENNFFFLPKLYLIISTFIILPIVTLISQFNGVPGIHVEDILVFMLNILLFYFLVEALKKDLDFRTVVIFALISFGLALIIGQMFFGKHILFWHQAEQYKIGSGPHGILVLLEGYSGGRYTGGATDPNQMAFYLLGLLFLASFYLNKFWFIILFIMFFLLGNKTGSDGFMLGAVCIGIFYILMQFIYIKILPLRINLIIFGLIFLSLFIYTDLLTYIIDYIKSGDESGYRAKLLETSFEVIKNNPIVGLGAGAFVGESMLQGKEAHNTFLDLAMMFGILFPTIIYLIFTTFVINLFLNKQYFSSATLIGFMALSVTHFVARHFIFWIILAFIVSELLKSKKSFENKKIDNFIIKKLEG